MTARRRAELQADVERAQRWRQQIQNDLDDLRARTFRLTVELGEATDAVHAAEIKARENKDGEEKNGHEARKRNDVARPGH